MGRPALWLDDGRINHGETLCVSSWPFFFLRRFLHYRPADLGRHLFDLARHAHRLRSGCDLGRVCAQAVQDGSEVE